MEQNLYGQLMFRGDLDVLEEVMDCNHRYFKGIAVLDGTKDHFKSRRILEKYPNIFEYIRDEELPLSYGPLIRDGARQVLLEAIQKKYGYDGYIFNLHSDEMIYDMSPYLLTNYMDIHQKEVGVISNVHFFLHTEMAETYVYNPEKSVIDQIPWACFPGFMEHRIFKNKKGISYDIKRHSLTVPLGLGDFVITEFPLRHYLYRSCEQMIKHIRDRKQRKWQTYGSNFAMEKNIYFMDCLPGYQFSRKILPHQKIINGITGDLSP